MKKLIAIVLVLMLTFGPAYADESTLSVSGNGKVYMEADQVSAILGVMLSGKDLAKVQAEVNKTVGLVCDALEATGMDEKSISTNYIYVTPNYDYNNPGPEQELVGYTVNNSLSITTGDTDSIGAYIDAAFAAGANTFDSISFSVKDANEARDEALALAVQQARRKAEVIAAASGKSLGDIIEIHEGAASTSYNSNAYTSSKLWMEEAVAEAVETTVRAAQVSVSASVQIIFELK